MKQHPNLIAWNKWMSSDEGKKCLDGVTEGEFLKNRLWYAFMAGLAYGYGAASAHTEEEGEA